MKFFQDAENTSPGFRYGITGIVMGVALSTLWFTAAKTISFPERTSLKGILFMMLAFSTPTIVGVGFGIKSIGTYRKSKQKSINSGLPLPKKSGLYAGLASVALSPPIFLQIIWTIRSVLDL